jgi:glycosyltransferase involved in cell wall biosynthesis
MGNCLITSYYKDKSDVRQEELDRCVSLNCFVFDKVILLADDNVTVPRLIEEDDKVTIFRVSERPTFEMAFSIISDHNPYGVNVIANTDVYFKQEDVALLDNVNWASTALALSRTDEFEDGSTSHWFKRDSQDAWVFKGELRVEADFGFGIPGCDNRIAQIIRDAGYNVYNPCNTIRCYHVHNTAVRNYNRKKDRVLGDYYLVDPCFFNEFSRPQFYGFAIISPAKRRKKDVSLTIIIPTLKSRRQKYMALVKEIFRQIDDCCAHDFVEVLHSSDEGERPVGKKRNAMIKRAKGDYVVNIDDDDRISPDYLSKILHAIEEKPDCVTFKGKVTINGKNERDYNYSLDCKSYNFYTTYNRPPGHLTPIKTEIARQFKHQELTQRDRGSDVDWAMQIVKAGVLETSVHIDEYLYFYDRVLNKPHEKFA